MMEDTSCEFHALLDNTVSEKSLAASVILSSFLSTAASHLLGRCMVVVLELGHKTRYP